MFPTFSWTPASGESYPLVVHAPNVFFEALRITFGPFPLTLSTSDIRALCGMATSSLGERAYEDCIAALQGYGTITVTAEF